MEYDIYEHKPDWITDGPWYNTSICKKVRGTVFEKYIRNARTNRYNLICSIDAHEKQQPVYVNEGIRGCGNAIPLNFTTEAID